TTGRGVGMFDGTLLHVRSVMDRMLFFYFLQNDSDEHIYTTRGTRCFPSHGARKRPLRGGPASRVAAYVPGVVSPAVSFLSGDQLDERPQRARLPRRGIPSFLPAQSIRHFVGTHELGPRGQP